MVNQANSTLLLGASVRLAGKPVFPGEGGIGTITAILPGGYAVQWEESPDALEYGSEEIKSA